ncbi:hypothetical protein [Solemya velesiana gill symbiont]|nr:hypothetical protein [Solemya velesiana gill symbiont]
MKQIMVILMVLVFVVFGAGTASAAKGGNGHGAGGVAADQANEMGMEKGKRYATPAARKRRTRTGMKKRKS